MLDPFAFYSRMVSTALGIAETAHRMSETMGASQEVIATRTKMLGDAARAPLEGDYAELGRMVPEKMNAFAASGFAMASDWWAMQFAFMAEARHLGAFAMKGRAPTFAEVSALVARQTRFTYLTIERASAMGGKGLRPIHAAVTANARRMKRTKA